MQEYARIRQNSREYARISKNTLECAQYAQIHTSKQKNAVYSCLQQLCGSAASVWHLDLPRHLNLCARLSGASRDALTFLTFSNRYDQTADVERSEAWHFCQRATNLNTLALLKVRSTLRREMWLQLMR